MRKVATILVLAMAAALLAAQVAALARDRDHSPGGQNALPRLLIAQRFHPAGTPGERILQSMYRRSGWMTGLPSRREMQYTRQERDRLGLIDDPTYLRGRVAIEDILPGQVLEKASFRP